MTFFKMPVMLLWGLLAPAIAVLIKAIAKVIFRCVRIADADYMVQ